MPLDRHIHFAQLWLEQVRDHLASAAATSTNLSAEQLNVMSGKVAEGLRIFTELADQPPAQPPTPAPRVEPPPALRTADPRYPAIPPWRPSGRTRMAGHLTSG
ncbi:hypothetical protein BJY24_002435 [Nocardia transvalensis]|uniref:Uncharacterized protein n=1 Tax=Nocardia transvalensis TaxID=37333 RepID=A0A7W9PDD3_9NOCA|nr:DUF6374 family protein [Nocardia transvalensis]MBB5913568.1 hypothetical protein [Nocardia transvalensis]